MSRSKTIGDMTPSNTPLRKKDAEGKVYTRPPNIEAKLVEIHALSRDEISSRCAVQDRTDPHYIPNECLLHLVRAHRSIPLDACSEMLFKALLARVLQG